MITQKLILKSKISPEELVEKINSDQNIFGLPGIIRLSYPISKRADLGKASFASYLTWTKLKFEKTNTGTEVELISRPSILILFILTLFIIMILVIIFSPNTRFDGEYNPAISTRLLILPLLLIPGLFLAISIWIRNGFNDKIIAGLGLTSSENSIQHRTIPKTK